MNAAIESGSNREGLRVVILLAFGSAFFLAFTAAENGELDQLLARLAVHSEAVRRSLDAGSMTITSRTVELDRDGRSTRETEIVERSELVDGRRVRTYVKFTRNGIDVLAEEQAKRSAGGNRVAGSGSATSLGFTMPFSASEKRK